MAVPGDGLARRPPGYRGMVPEDWPSIRTTSGWQPPAEISEDGAKQALQILHDHGALICGGRYCFTCGADLSDAGGMPHESSAPAGYKAATGVYPEYTLSIPRGGHAPDCPVPYLLRWIGEPESPYTRLRTEDIDDELAKMAVMAKSPMELVGTDLERLSEAERSARVDVLAGFGLTEQDRTKS